MKVLLKVLESAYQSTTESDSGPVPHDDAMQQVIAAGQPHVLIMRLGLCLQQACCAFHNTGSLMRCSDMYCYLYGQLSWKLVVVNLSLCLELVSS